METPSPFFRGVYSDPEWSGDNLPQDWIDFVGGIIERSRRIREHVEAAPPVRKPIEKRGCSRRHSLNEDYRIALFLSNTY
jgi:hypothetical protein